MGVALAASGCLVVAVPMAPAAVLEVVPEVASAVVVRTSLPTHIRVKFKGKRQAPSNREPRYPASASMPTRSCCIESRSRTVAA